MAPNHRQGCQTCPGDLDLHDDLRFAPLIGLQSEPGAGGETQDRRAYQAGEVVTGLRSVVERQSRGWDKPCQVRREMKPVRPQMLMNIREPAWYIEYHSILYNYYVNNWL